MVLSGVLSGLIVACVYSFDEYHAAMEQARLSKRTPVEPEASCVNDTTTSIVYTHKPRVFDLQEVRDDAPKGNHRSRCKFTREHIEDMKLIMTVAESYYVCGEGREWVPRVVVEDVGAETCTFLDASGFRDVPMFEEVGKEHVSTRLISTNVMVTVILGVLWLVLTVVTVNCLCRGREEKVIPFDVV